MKKFFALVLALALLLSAGALAAKVGEEAPDFELTTLTGEPFKLSEQRGKVVFLNIWATWCPPCQAEMPDIQRFCEAHPDDLAVIGASVDNEQATVEQYISENGFTYPIAMDEGFKLAGELYRTEAIPLSVFISPSGVVTYMEPGMLDGDDLEELYQQALANG